MMNRRDFFKLASLPLLPFSGSLAAKPLQMNNKAPASVAAPGEVHLRVLTLGVRAHPAAGIKSQANVPEKSFAIDTDALVLSGLKCNTRYHYQDATDYTGKTLWGEFQAFFQGADIALIYVDLDSPIGSEGIECLAANAARLAGVYMVCCIGLGNEDKGKYAHTMDYQEWYAHAVLFHRVNSDHPAYLQHYFHMLHTALVRMPLEERQLVGVDLADIKAGLAKNGHSFINRKSGSGTGEVLAKLNRALPWYEKTGVTQASHLLVHLSLPELAGLEDVYRIMDWFHENMKGAPLTIFGANDLNPLGETHVTWLATGIQPPDLG